MKLPNLALRRFGEAHAQGAEAINRAAGQGAGYGYLPMALLADVFSNANQLFTGIGSANAVDMTNSAATFQISSPVYVRVSATAWIAVTAGADFFYAQLILDGSFSSTALSGDGPKGYYTAPFELVAFLQPGSHTAKIRGFVGAAGTTGKIVQAETFVYQLGA